MAEQKSSVCGTGICVWKLYARSGIIVHKLSSLSCVCILSFCLRCSDLIYHGLFFCFVFRKDMLVY